MAKRGWTGRGAALNWQWFMGTSKVKQIKDELTKSPFSNCFIFIKRFNAKMIENKMVYIQEQEAVTIRKTYISSISSLRSFFELCVNVLSLLFQSKRHHKQCRSNPALGLSHCRQTIWKCSPYAFNCTTHTPFDKFSTVLTYYIA